MIKSKKEILEEYLNDAITTVIGKEIGIRTLKKMKSDEVIATKLDGRPMTAKERIVIMEKELVAEKLRLEIIQEEYNSLTQ
jgi:hypothetical protein